MTALEQLVDRYCEGWSAATPDERAALISASLTTHATYCDPRADNLSVPELLEHITRVSMSRPGARVVRTSAVDAHHGVARFHWHVVMPDGTTLPEGLDYIELSADGDRISRVVGFFGPLAAREPDTPVRP